METNETHDHLRLRVPTPVAEALINGGHARPVPTLRSPVPQLLVDGVEAAATTITLLQGPKTVRAIARQILAWTSSTPVSDQTPTKKVVIVAKSTPDELRLEITTDTDIDAVVTLVDRTVTNRHR